MLNQITQNTMNWFIGLILYPINIAIYHFIHSNAHENPITLMPSMTKTGHQTIFYKSNKQWVVSFMLSQIIFRLFKSD